MLIIAINGSPDPSGNTSFLLNSALDEIKAAGAEGHFMQASEIVSKAKTPYCIACTNPCNGGCYRGTALEEAYELLSRCDGVIVGSPVYFCTVSAQMKAFWDKARLLRNNKALINVVGGALAVGAARFGGQETTVRALHDIMLCQGMTVVGDGFIEEDAGHQGACAQRMAKDDQDGIKRSRILARRVLQVASATVDLRAHRTPGK